jgi:hypothetical protein
MKTLFTLFSKERSELQQEIDKATSPEQVVKLVQNRLDGLEKSYMGGLSVTQVRLAAFFLDTLRQSIGTLTAANETKVSELETKQPATQSTRFPSNSLILKVLQALISVSILGSLFSLTQDAPGAWMGILLMLVLVGLEVVLQLDKDKQKNSSDSFQSVEVPQVIVQVDSNVLLDNLDDALNTIDLAVASAETGKKALDASGIEELPELLNLVQRLMGASVLENPLMAIELTKLLPQILMEQGIRAQNYRPNEAHSGREYFDFEPSIDRSAKDYVTITPALLKGDRLLRRGRVIEPAYSELKEGN